MSLVKNGPGRPGTERPQLSAQYAVPVVLIVFNRPGVTRRVFDAIARVKPRRLMVIADGARPDRAGEEQLVMEVRSIVDSVNWPCEVSRNYADRNLGCKRRVITGLNWVFEQVEQAIILEDDCVPSPAFFRYCREMLDEYRDDRRVFAVSGSNFSRTAERPGHYFSNFALMWGWATWRDRWLDYVPEPADHREVISRMWRGRPVAWAYWSRIFSTLERGALESVWDYQWILTVWRHAALVCRPTINLVENIGFGADATHTTVEHGSLAGLTAVDVPGSFRGRVGSYGADVARDAIDEREWALISLRSVALMYLPWLGTLRKRLA